MAPGWSGRRGWRLPAVLSSELLKSGWPSSSACLCLGVGQSDGMARELGTDADAVQRGDADDAGSFFHPDRHLASVQSVCGAPVPRWLAFPVALALARTGNLADVEKEGVRYMRVSH